MKPTVLVDMDGVLVDLLPTWLEHYRQVGGEARFADEFTAYHWESQVDNPQLFKKVLESGGLFYCAPPMPGALAGLALLRATTEVYIVTKVMAGNSRAFDAKGGWLWRHVHPKFPRDQVIFTGAKHLVRGDVLVEDAPENLARWLNAWPDGRGFLIDQPYNQGFTHPRATRVHSLLEVSEILNVAK